PLHGIVGFVGALLSANLTPSQRDAALSAIDRNARALTRLIADMLDHTRIAEGKMPLELSTIDVRPVVEAAVERVRSAADAKPIVLDVALDEMPPVAGDSERLQQVIWNLLSNAVKFTTPGGRVMLRGQHQDGM